MKTTKNLRLLSLALLVSSCIGIQTMHAAAAQQGQKRNRLEVLNGELLQASRIGDLAQTYNLLLSGANPNCQDEDGETSLYLASKAGHNFVVEMLLAAKADIDNVSNDDSETPLLAASENGHLEVVRKLLAARASLENPDFIENRALHYACVKGYPEIARELLSARADVQAQGCGYSTPLHFASEKGCPEIVNMLLHANANIEARNEDDGYEGYYFATPLHVAAEYGHQEVISSLIEAKADVHAQDIDGFTPLHFASGVHGVTPLHFASGVHGFIPLHFASGVHDKAESVRRLLAAGADKNIATKDGQLALEMALISNHHVARALLSDSDLATYESTTFLHKAIDLVLKDRKRGLDLLNMLLHEGADVSSRSAKCKNTTPLEYAQSLECTDACTLIEQEISVRAGEFGTQDHILNHMHSDLEKRNKIHDVLKEETEMGEVGLAKMMFKSCLPNIYRRLKKIQEQQPRLAEAAAASSNE